MRISTRSQLALLLCAAILLGGGGVAYGLMNLAVQLIGLAILAANRTAFIGFWREAPRALSLLIALTVALPLLQLVPLPPDWWQALPGRELAVEAREAVGADGWYALTLDRNRTLVAAAGMIAPLCVLIMAWRLPMRDLLPFGWLLVGLALANFAIGVPQVLSNGASAILYPENPMPGVLFGTYANRNSAGIFLVACLAMLSLPLERGADGRLWIARLVISALLIVAILLTRSRSATVLMLLPLGLIAWKELAGRWRWRQAGIVRWLAPLTGIAAVLGLLFVAAPGTRIEDSLSRFSAGSDARAFIWEDAAHSARKYWPAGAGIGTFDEVFQADESLENLTVRRAGRAHNDYLEVVIEAGMPGAALIALWLMAIAWLSLKARSSPHRQAAWAGATTLAVVALQSISDYPLRNQAMLCVCAFAFALLARASQPSREVAQ